MTNFQIRNDPPPSLPWRFSKNSFIVGWVGGLPALRRNENGIPVTLCQRINICKCCVKCFPQISREKKEFNISVLASLF